ncbi:Metalloenzyme, LuxS/M16 peptidase-like protein [Phellopilus nigrolimitatus]|nr:Metalloenzyme, LuxS/M16 peptidase-like protein [Phellopilus nigrolimitatus]
MTETYGNFDLIQRVKLDITDVVLTKWRSRITGLSIVHLDYESPIVNGYFTVGTEIFNDSGCPHALEHLVFMGSKKYPLNGTLSQIANRSFSDGLNATTCQDRTFYTVSTAGGQGFLQILPIYVDHILYPTLTQSAFVTEVHHIDPSGSDSGVVSNEMQGHENSTPDVMTRHGYRSDAGGVMEAVRTLDMQQIRDYHAKYYVPHNLCLIVGGKFTGGTESLLSVVQNEIEPTLVANGQNNGIRGPPGWARPFVETPSADRVPFESKTVTVELPPIDEEVGTLVIIWMGPPPNDYLTRNALNFMAKYLTSSPIAPLNAEYIETDNPLCTNIFFQEEVRANFIQLGVEISSVLIEHLDTFNEKLKHSLNVIIEDGIDMARMLKVIDRNQRQLRSALESDRASVLSPKVMTDFILGPEDGSELHETTDETTFYDELRKWTSDQWTALIKRYYIGSPSVVIRGRPSRELTDRLKREESARINARVQKRDPEGLAKAKYELENAKKDNNVPIPEAVLTKFPVPDVSSIAWIPVQSVQEGGKVKPTSTSKTDNSQLRKHINADGSKLPFFVHFDHVESDFVTVRAVLSLAKLPNRLRPIFAVYMSSFFSLPVTTSSGERLTHEEVVTRLDNETVSYGNHLGLQGNFSETFCVSIETEKGMYEAAVRWMKDLLYNAEFDMQQLQVICAKKNLSYNEEVDVQDILYTFSAKILYEKSSTRRSHTPLVLMKAIPEIMERIRKNPKGVRKDFEKVRKYLTDPSGIRFSVAGNVLDLPKPRSTWGKYFKNLIPGGRFLQFILPKPRSTWGKYLRNLIPDVHLEPIKLGNETLNDVGRNPRKKAVVLSPVVGENAFATFTAKGVQDFQNAEYPALCLALEVLNATGGHLLQSIRGSGLAYAALMHCDLEVGHLSFTIHDSSDILRAYGEAAKVVERLVKRTIALEDTAVDAAKSAIVYKIANAFSTPRAAAVTSFVDLCLRGLNESSSHTLKKFQAVTKDEILTALKKYCLPLFSPDTSIAVVLTSQGRFDSTASDLRSLGFDVEKKTF